MTARLYPEQNPGEDRIWDQLTYRPCINHGAMTNQSKPLNILLWEGSNGWEHVPLQKGRKVTSIVEIFQYFSHFSLLSCQYYIAALKNFQVFEEDQCEVRNCEISMERNKMAEADLVLFKTPNFRAPTLRKPKGQVAILIFCPKLYLILDLYTQQSSSSILVAIKRHKDSTLKKQGSFPCPIHSICLLKMSFLYRSGCGTILRALAILP